MKAKHTILIIAIGFCLDFLGSLLRTMHAAHANNVLVAAAVFKIAGILLLVYKVVNYEGFRKFMER